MTSTKDDIPSNTPIAIIVQVNGEIKEEVDFTDFFSYHAGECTTCTLLLLDPDINPEQFYGFTCKTAEAFISKRLLEAVRKYVPTVETSF